jgi:cob(I)alamin adenosyltransferase
MKIYTKTGDKGHTSLVDGTRISKSHPRIAVLGAMDELNAAIGLLLVVVPKEDAMREMLLQTQSCLFNCGSRLAEPTKVSKLTIKLPDGALIKHYEQSIDAMTAELEPLNRFILPGGSELSARTHWVRSVVRRVEREIVMLHESGETVDPLIQQFINRLSDWFFTLARYYAKLSGEAEVLWKG